jgi:hypothetical protein
LPAEPGDPCTVFPSLDAAEAACSREASCFAVCLTKNGYELREGSDVAPSTSGKVSWLVTNAGTDGCRAWKPVPIGVDATW